MERAKLDAIAATLSAMDDDDWRALPEADRRALVAEAFHTFNEDTARDLADKLDVDFEACGEDIVKAGQRLH